MTFDWYLLVFLFFQVKDVLFEPVRKIKNAEFFRKRSNGNWVPCKPTKQGAIKITLNELDKQGHGPQVFDYMDSFITETSSLNKLSYNILENMLNVDYFMV